VASQAAQPVNPDATHSARLNEGVAAWNRWRADEPGVMPDLRGARLASAQLPGIDLHGAQLQDADFCGADLTGANLNAARIERTLFNEAHFGHADMRGVMGFAARFIGCDLRACRFGGGGFFEAMFWDADLRGCDLRQCNFKGASFDRAQLADANFDGCTLDGVRWDEVQADRVSLQAASMQLATITQSSLVGMQAAGLNLTGSRLMHNNMSGAALQHAVLHVASLINLNLVGASLAGAQVFGVAAWHLHTEGADQRDLVITPLDAAVVSCDDLETAQFIYLLLNNEKLRQVIDAVGKKTVLLLGRFTTERKAVLDALRHALRARGLVPILFDFEKPAGRDLTETVSTLAHLARFVIADLTDPRSIPQELKAIVPALPSVPVQCLLHASQDAYAMFADLGGYASVLPPVRYRDLAHLLTLLDADVIAPAERRVLEIAARRAAFEAQLGPA
jgi:uncharacterized protein YjbI with pentapeptide repeats